MDRIRSALEIFLRPPVVDHKPGQPNDAVVCLPVMCMKLRGFAEFSAPSRECMVRVTPFPFPRWNYGGILPPPLSWLAREEPSEGDNLVIVRVRPLRSIQFWLITRSHRATTLMTRFEDFIEDVAELTCMGTPFSLSMIHG